MQTQLPSFFYVILFIYFSIKCLYILKNDFKYIVVFFVSYLRDFAASIWICEFYTDQNNFFLFENDVWQSLMNERKKVKLQ